MSAPQIKLQPLHECRTCEHEVYHATGDGGVPMVAMTQDDAEILLAIVDQLPKGMILPAKDRKRLRQIASVARGDA